MTEKTNTLMAANKTDFCRYKNARIRRLTPTECAALQTIPRWYEWMEGDKPTSDTQIYRMCGNGWTVDVIKHFFQFLPKEWRNAEPKPGYDPKLNKAMADAKTASEALDG